MTIEIADRLTALRRERGMSQEELAEKLHVSRQAVSKWERAEASPDTDNLIALAELYQRTRSAVYGLALSYLKNAQDAQDLTQDVYVQVWDCAAQYRPSGSPMGSSG